jgi:uncharacterized damage-inducible protein DinB
MTKQDFIDGLNLQRSNTLKAIDGLSDEEISRPMAEGKWSIKDTLGHLAAWEGEVVKGFRQKANGERPSISDIKEYDPWNATETAKRKDLSADEIRAELMENRENLLSIVQAFPEDDEKVWDPARYTAKMLGMLMQHDAHHCKAICDYRGIDVG